MKFSTVASLFGLATTTLAASTAVTAIQNVAATINATLPIYEAAVSKYLPTLKCSHSKSPRVMEVTPFQTCHHITASKPI